jgi:hypothetical protein
MSSLPPTFVKEQGPGAKNGFLIGLIAVLLSLVLTGVVLTALFAFFFMGNEPGGTPSVASVTTSTGTSWGLTPFDQGIIGSPLPPSATVLLLERDDRGIDGFVQLKFTATESDAIAFATSATGTPPAAGFVLQDIGTGVWGGHPSQGRGSSSDPAVSPIARRVLLSDPDANGITTVWVIANET